MTTVLIICACLLVYAIYKNLQTKDNTHKKDDRNIKVSILTSTDGETFHESKTIDYKSHHEQMRLRDKTYYLECITIYGHIQKTN